MSVSDKDPCMVPKLNADSADLAAILERSRAAGVQSMIITGTSLAESKEALEMAARYGAFRCWLSSVREANHIACRTLCNSWVPPDIDLGDRKTRKLR